MKERLSDPFVRSVIVLGAMAVTGLVGIALAWESLADTLVVSTQVSYATSGGLGGLAVLGFALGLLAIQATRRAEARERADLARVTEGAAALLAELRGGS